MKPFSIRPLDEDQVGRAYFLIKARTPAVSAAQWSRYARSLVSRGGLIGLFGPEDALFGLLAYRAGDADAPAMKIDHLVTLELSHDAPFRKALIGAAEEIALGAGCSGLELAGAST